jgi:hypothetical protein
LLNCIITLVHDIDSICCGFIGLRLGSFGSNPDQEEVDGYLSMPLLGLWIGRAAAEDQTSAVPKHKIEEHVSRELRVVHLDLAAGGRLSQKTCHSPDRTQPAFLMCELCQLRKLDSLRRKNPLRRTCLGCQRVCEHVPVNLIERFLDKIKQCVLLAANCLAFIKLASIRIWLRANESTF